MRRSKLFIKTRKEIPADETAKNAQLLMRAGYIHKEMAGVYDFLPLGLMVLNNIMSIIRQEMNDIGGQELNMSTLQDHELWKSTERWDEKNVDIWFKTALQNGTPVGLGWTHEEPITRLMTQFIKSYKDLPAYPYQFQTKFRNEQRSKSGIMRTREFIMKDLYSFSTDQKSHDEFYEKAKQAYIKIFDRVGLGELTYLTFASGGSFSKFSHEFQTVTDVGEDIIYVQEAKRLAINKEVYSPSVLEDLELNKNDMVEKKATEVGNIFTLGTRFSEPLGLNFTDEDGKSKPVIMGCYGIGPARLMGTIVEHFADDMGLVWPENIAPYTVYLASLGAEPEISQTSNELYARLAESGVRVLYDDRDERPGEKFADADLFGIPYRVVISQKSLQAGGIELKSRTSTDIDMLPTDRLLSKLTKARQA